MLKTYKDDTIIIEKKHNHLQNFALNEALYTANSIKERSINTTEISRNIINTCIKNISYELINFLPSYINLQKKNFKRKNRNYINLNPENDIPESINLQIREIYFIYSTQALIVLIG
ncbi:hypothetical protein DMUE_2149 [Dictyocoela muelleri]|nr:hypothetical protein DMUE_2149 [Dictyocoela muelleri]